MGLDMVGLAQMVRASDCGPEGRQFDSDIPPHIVNDYWSFCMTYWLLSAEASFL